MADYTYRQWLQDRAAHGTSDTVRQQAQALLQVAGDDGKIDTRFIADAYDPSLTGQGRNAEYGQFYGYGPAGMQLINNEMFKAYNSPNSLYGADQVQWRQSGTGGTGTTSTTGLGTTGNNDAQKRAVNEASRRATQSAIDQLDTRLQSGYQGIDNEYNKVLSKYSNEATKAQADYDEQSHKNTEELLRNKQNALLAGAQGARGLSGVLGSIGALSGTGLDLRNRAVQQAMNADLAGASDTYGANAENLSKAYTTFKEEDEDRRRELEDQRANQRQAHERGVMEDRQRAYQKMADLFGDIGDATGASSWLDKVANMNRPIAERQGAIATPFTSRAAAFTPGALKNYLAGAGDMTVSVGGAPTGASISGLPSLLAGRRRRQNEDEEY